MCVSARARVHVCGFQLSPSPESGFLNWTGDVISGLICPLQIPFDTRPRYLSVLPDPCNHSRIVLENAFDRANAGHLACGLRKAATQSAFSPGKNNMQFLPFIHAPPLPVRVSESSVRTIKAPAFTCFRCRRRGEACDAGSLKQQQLGRTGRCLQVWSSGTANGDNILCLPGYRYSPS